MFFNKKKKNSIKKIDADLEFNKIGFVRLTDKDDTKVVYRKLRECNNKYHFIEISMHTGKTLIFSYQVKRLNKCTINKCVPLTYEEYKLCDLKIREMGWDK